MSFLNLVFNEKFINDKLYQFNSQKRIKIDDSFLTKSAVLFSIMPYENRPYDLIIIHRTDRGSRHSGEMSFPGGKFDPLLDNSLEETALRETEEEIGVPKSRIKIIGCLDDMVTLTKFIVTPFIGMIDKDQILVKEEREVQEILKIPIDFFTLNINSLLPEIFFTDKKIDGDFYNLLDFSLFFN